MPPSHSSVGAWVVVLATLLPAPSAPADVEPLRAYLVQPTEERGPIGAQAFAARPLSKADADAARALLWADHVKRIRAERAAEVAARKLVDGKLEMPFAYTVFGERPAGGRSLFISMHGGGGTAKRVNDQQWENQKRLYKPAEGVYLAPRAPTDHWNLWHEPHIDRMFGRLIEDLIVLEDVDPNRVYLMGYSAGGDGVYQLAPRMADRWAAASMMAGHPNDASPLGLRNVPFAIHVGANDGGFKRNEVAREWGRKLDALAAADPQGYLHLVKLHEGRGHWMNREDAEAVPWMVRYTRNPAPKKVVWKQAGTTHDRFYWLAVPTGQAKPGAEVIASYDGQTVTIERVSGGVERLLIRLNDHMLDLDKPVAVIHAGQTLSQAVIPRTAGVLAKTLAERGDPAAVFGAELEVRLPATDK